MQLFHKAAVDRHHNGAFVRAAENPRASMATVLAGSTSTRSWPLAGNVKTSNKISLRILTEREQLIAVSRFRGRSR